MSDREEQPDAKVICPICDRVIRVRNHARGVSTDERAKELVDPCDDIARLIREQGCSTCWMAGLRLPGARPAKPEDGDRR